MTFPKPILVSMGDPAGCGPKLCQELWANRRVNAFAYPLVFVGCPKAFAHYGIHTRKIEDAALLSQASDYNKQSDILPLLHAESISAPIETGHPKPKNAGATIDAIRLATQTILHGKGAALVTAPIAKSVLYRAGFTFPGHTEFLAQLCSPDIDTKTETNIEHLTPVMMLTGGGLRVALATIHIPLMQVAQHLTIDRLKLVGEIVDRDLKVKFGLKTPRIAFSGLNPHAGEGGSIGREEVDIIIPAAQSLRDSGVNISDPRPADTVFHEALTGQFDAVIAMTHDQGLIPVKTLDLWGGVNNTLGLPIIRTSPDHGTAFEATKACNLNPTSMIAAFDSACEQIAAKQAHLDG